MAASDASEEREAGMILKDGEVDEDFVWSRVGNTDDIIFLREIKAAVETVRRILLVKGGKPVAITLAVDNTAAVYALRRGWSSNRLADIEVQKLYNYLRGTKSTLEVVPVRGIDNIADVPTRSGILNDADARRRLRATLDTVDNHRAGNGKIEAIVNVFRSGKSRGNSRHDENYENDDFDSIIHSATEDAMLEKMGAVDTTEDVC